MTAKATKEPTTTEKAPKNPATTEPTAKKGGTKEGHDAKGRFTKGNKGGPGNPFYRQCATLRTTLLFLTTPVDIARAAEALKKKAFEGDVPAIKLYFQYVLGKPAETVDPDRMAVDEWQKHKEQAIDPEEVAHVMQQCSTSLANSLVEENWPNEMMRKYCEARDENAELEAQLAEDERYMEELEKAEEEALRQRAMSGDPSPACDPSPAYLQACAAGETAPSPNVENGASVHQKPKSRQVPKSDYASRSEHAAQASAASFTRTPSPIGDIGGRTSDGWLECVRCLTHAGPIGAQEEGNPLDDLFRPSPNGQETDAAGAS
jgi:hypothetical protein